jgi:hypothetical protein
MLRFGQQARLLNQLLIRTEGNGFSYGNGGHDLRANRAQVPGFFLLASRIFKKRHLLGLEPGPATGAGAVAGTASLISMAQRGKA